MHFSRSTTTSTVHSLGASPSFFKVYIFCHTSIHRCCCPVSGFPGFLKDFVMMSRSLALRVLITSIVFQSETAKRARFPSRMKTPAYIWWEAKSQHICVSLWKHNRILTSHRTSPQRRAIENSSMEVVSWAL